MLNNWQPNTYVSWVLFAFFFSHFKLLSGAYLPSYAEKVLHEEKGEPSASPFLYSRDDGKPLRALSRREEKVFRKICSRREEIAGEVAAIQAELLKGVKPFRLESELGSRATDKGSARKGEARKNKSSMNVRKRKGEC